MGAVKSVNGAPIEISPFSSSTQALRRKVRSPLPPANRTQVSDAIAAMVALQREHRERIAQWPPKLVMQIKVGMASGNIVRVDGDCYGEAVNLAARLCDMAAPSEIWATAQVTDAAPLASGVRVRALGPVAIRGMAEAREVCQIH